MCYIFHVAQGDVQNGQNDGHELEVVVYACNPVTQEG